MKKLNSVICASLVAASVATASEPVMVPTEVMCASTEMILNGIKEKYNEDLLFLGGPSPAENENNFTTLFVNKDTGTWTILLTNKKEKITCVLASGETFQSFGVFDSVGI